ncbi:type VI secretion system-associated protein TagF [Rhizobium mayense]|uniref:Type VI secretion system-associated protein TagF n=1 Tax=Rhizobium mayense TaxID=1312184 RepID=A0ABT7JR38_9HYPH|nr:type VI secretion system-associated protein TagF [Rhizobium mayense]MDL2398814.1 type VI secretion system-associated protein TagF [Rhizobium mayense]
MEAQGYFGKVPSVGDFVFRALPVRMTEVWASQMQRWLAAARPIGGASFQESFLTSPVWRFALARDVVSPEAWVGLFAGSIDRVGREFPFTVMISVDLDPVARQPIATIDALFDPLETRMLAFMEEHATREELVAEIDVCAEALRAALKRLPADGDRELLMPRDGEDMLCLSGPVQHGSSRTAYSWTGAGDGASRLCLWWHDDTRTQPAALSVSRGLPAAQAAIPFLLGEWLKHGWILSALPVQGETEA